MGYTANSLAMSVRVYRVSGKMKIKNVWQKFSLEVTATKPYEAIEKVYCELGSRHKLPRNLIKIESVREIKPEEARRKEILELLMLEYFVKW